MNNKAIITLYLNTDIINNLFTILIYSFMDEKSISTKNQVSLNIKAPLSELLDNNYEQCKPQGDFNLQISNESSKQKTKEQISTNIIIFMELMKILKEQNIIKYINTTEDMFDIQIYDYVQFTSRLTLNPLIQYITNLIKALQVEIIFSKSKKNKDEIKEVLSQLKDDLNDFKKNNCLKFISDEIFNSNYKFIMLLQEKYIQNNIEYLNNPHITVVGKVINVYNENNIKNSFLKSESYLDYLSESTINEFKNKFLNNSTTLEDFRFQKICNNFTIIEVIPLAIYI